MKKNLLLSAIALFAVSAYADYTDFYNVYYGDEELTDGSTIVCDNGHFNVAEELNYACDINYVNASISDVKMEITIEEVSGDFGDSFFQICYAVGEGGEGLCLNEPPYITTLPNIFVSNFYWQLHIYQAVPEGKAVYKLTTTVADSTSTETNYVPAEGSEFTVYVELGNYTNGISSIGSDDNSAPVYFDLQGHKVANPERGIFIMKQGNNVVKKIFR